MTAGSRRLVCLLLLALSVAFVGASAGCSREYRRRRDMASKDPSVRAAAARRIAKQRPKAALQMLSRLLEDRAPRVRMEAATGLGRLGDARAARPLGAALRDRDPRVRLAAVRGLAKLGREAAAEHLLTALEDGNRLVRRAASFALADLGVDQVVQARRVVSRRVYRLRRMLTNKLSARRVEAAKMLGRAGREGVVADLERLAGDQYVQVAEEATRALGMIGGARAVAFLERLWSSGGGARRLARPGILALLAARAQEATDLARRLLVDGDRRLRDAALEHLLARKQQGAAIGSELLCEALRRSQPEDVVRWGVRLRGAGVRCPPRAKDPAAARLAALTGEGPLGSAMAAWVGRELVVATPGRRGVGLVAIALASLRGDSALRAALLARVRRTYQELLLASERWLDEKKWRRLDRLPTVKGVLATSPQSEETVPSGSGATPRRRKLQRLLDRFPRHWDPRKELLPSEVGPASVVEQIRWLAGLSSAMEWLAALIRRAPVPIRIAALEVLGRSRCHLPACRKAWRLASVDGSAVVRAAAAAAAVGVVGLEPKALLLLLGDPAVTVRSAAALSIARLKVPGAYEALLGRFRKSRQAYLVEAFGVLGDPRAERVLLALLREEQSPLMSGERLGVIEALGRLATRASVDRLVLELSHPEPALRLAAAKVLGRVADRRALGRLAVCAEDFFRVVRRACVAAKAAIQRREGAP